MSIIYLNRGHEYSTFIEQSFYKTVITNLFISNINMNMHINYLYRYSNY